jgi:hypothetical protein
VAARQLACTAGRAGCQLLLMSAGARRRQVSRGKTVRSSVMAWMHT